VVPTPPGAAGIVVERAGCFVTPGVFKVQGAGPCGETPIPQTQPTSESNHPMGDRSPKDNQKKTGQKQAKASTADQKKKAQAAAKQAASGKKK
jgi:hypothetical protein